MKNLAEFRQLPPPPDWLDSLLDEPFSQFTSLLVDRWLQYIEFEFEGVQ